MPLKSNLFRGNARLGQCLVSNSSHVKPGDKGTHVGDIQIALEYLDGLVIVPGERQQMFYGPSTAAAVLAYKKKRKIINLSYQATEDNVVGVMTMEKLDQDMFDRQEPPQKPRRTFCRQCGMSPPAIGRPMIATNPTALAHRFRDAFRRDSANA